MALPASHIRFISSSNSLATASVRRKTFPSEFLPRSGYQDLLLYYPLDRTVRRPSGRSRPRPRTATDPVTATVRWLPTPTRVSTFLPDVGSLGQEAPRRFAQHEVARIGPHSHTLRSTTPRQPEQAASNQPHGSGRQPPAPALAQPHHPQRPPRNTALQYPRF